ncbi:MAG: hypothetical protein F9K23_01180 [Bacteroidetes bacterium]|nr:MAG: hypothetical protein F9K23_01180 [Bacteroidota bacterium]
MKKTILFFVILLGFIAASTTVSAQCANARVHNRTAYDMYVTIYDQCGQNTGAVLVPANTPVVIPMPSATCAMLSGNIFYPTIPFPGNPCSGNHPICPPSSSPCTICSGFSPKTVTTTVTPLLPSGCEYDIDII